MQIRGAPLIGAVAAYGLCLAVRDDPSTVAMERDAAILAATRPTAVNLRWALERMLTRLRNTAAAEREAVAYAEAAAICEDDVACNQSIGRHGMPLIEAAAWKSKRRVNVLTHCNAGWLATVDWGTALAPIYLAHEAGIDLHVWVDETRPRNQGAALTAWELGRHGVPHTVIADNAGGHLMQHGEVDLTIVGTDRVTRTGDVANKIGTYLKALAARDNGVPFWVALPSSTIDWTVSDGIAEIPIEQRAAAEVTDVTGRMADGTIATVRVAPTDSDAANPAFDVTPARLVTGLITERGRCDASAAGLRSLFPERQ
jgi:methylthioribose-1-phosphate isomerase